jgi:hypothetical protein
MDYMKSSKVTEELGNAQWIPSIHQMKERNIIYHVLIQKPGDAVFVGYSTIHWVLTPVRL